MAGKLTTTSYVVLALVERMQPATAYDLKTLAHSTVFNFWALPHTVLYTETRKLAADGMLDADEESGGRRRRLFALTTAGRDALHVWRSEPTSDFLELRDPGLLRLFAGGDPQVPAAAQLERHQAQLDDYRELAAALDDQNETGDGATGLRSVLAAGIAIEETYIQFWASIVKDGFAR